MAEQPRGNDRATNSRVILIHGTWPNGVLRRVDPDMSSNWFHPRSPLARELRDRLGADVEVEPFIWSGANSVTKRRQASGQLARYLANGRADGGKGIVLIVAHSHGGTVAMETLYRYGEELRSTGVDLAGLICLASPFVYVRPLHDVQREDTLDVVTSLVLAAMLFAVLNWAPAVLAAPWWVLLLASIFVPWLTYAFIGVGSQLATEDTQWVSEYLPDPPADLPPIDVIRAPGDEASGLIGFASFIKWLLSKCYIATHRTSTNSAELRRQLRLGSFVRRSLAVVFASGAMFILLLKYSEVAVSLPWANLVLIALTVHEWLLAVPVALAYLGYAVACGLFRARRLGLVALEMEPLPPDCVSHAHMLEPPAGHDGLSHALHSWPTVQKYVADLARTRLATAKAAIERGCLEEDPQSGGRCQ